MFERYTKEARIAIFYAKEEARQLGSPEINAEHILLALLKDETIAARIVNSCSVEQIREELLAAIGRRGKEVVGPDIPLSRVALRVLHFAAAEADNLNDKDVRNEHLLLGLLHAKDSAAAQLLKQRGLTVRKVRSEVGALAEKTPAQQNAKRLWRSLVTRMFARSDKETVLLRRVCKLVGKGKSRKALKLLDDFMNEPTEDRISRIKQFAAHAAGIALAIGDFSLARKYYEQDLAYSPEDGLSLYGMAYLLDLRGEHEEARKYAVQCYQLATAGKDPLSQGILGLIESRFPTLEAIPPSASPSTPNSNPQSPNPETPNPKPTSTTTRPGPKEEETA